MGLDVFQDVKEQADPEGILDALLGPRDRSRKWRCPFHEDKTPSFSARDGGLVCFGCAWRGDVFRFVGELEGLSPLEAVRRVADLSGLVLPEGPPPGGWPSKLSLQVDRLRWESERLKVAIEREGRLAIAAGWRRAFELGRARHEEEAFEVVAQVAAIERDQAAAEAEQRGQCGHGSGREAPCQVE